MTSDIPCTRLRKLTAPARTRGRRCLDKSSHQKRLVAGVARRDIYSDVTSGGRAAAARPGMAKLLEYTESGGTVVVWRIDRLGRSLLDVLAVVNDLARRDIAVRSISDGIDPATPTGRLMPGLLGSLAE